MGSLNYAYPYALEFFLLDENFSKINYDRGIYDIADTINKENKKCITTPEYRYVLENAEPEYSGWSYDKKSDSLVKVLEDEPAMHPIYLKYVWNKSEIMIGDNYLYNPLFSPSLFMNANSPTMHVNLRDENATSDKEKIVLTVYMNGLGLSTYYLLHPLLLHEFRHVHDMFRAKNVKAYNNSLNVKYAVLLIKTEDIRNEIKRYAEWGLEFNPYTFREHWKNFPRYILTLKSKTEIKAIIASIEQYIEENEKNILTFFNRSSDNIGLNFIIYCSKELNISYMAIKHIRYEIEHAINTGSYVLPIFLTSVLMKYNFLGEKDETGFSDFKYFHEVQKHKITITEDIKKYISKMFEFVVKTIDSYFRVLSKNAERLLKKYGLYDKLCEMQDLKYRANLSQLICSYDVPSDISLRMTNQLLLEAQMNPMTDEDYIISQLKNNIYYEIKRIL